MGGDFIKRDTGLDAGRRAVTGVKPPNILRAGTDRDDDDISGPMSSLCHVSHNILFVSKFYLDFADHIIYFLSQDLFPNM